MPVQFQDITTSILDGVCKQKLKQHKGGPILGVPWAKDSYYVYIPAFGDRAAWQECLFETTIPSGRTLDSSYDQIATNDNPPKSGLKNRVSAVPLGFRVFGTAFVDVDNPGSLNDAGIIRLAYDQPNGRILVQVYAAPNAAYGYQIHMALV